MKGSESSVVGSNAILQAIASWKSGAASAAGKQTALRGGLSAALPFHQILEKEQEELIQDRFCFEWSSLPVVSSPSPR